MCTISFNNIVEGGVYYYIYYIAYIYLLNIYLLYDCIYLRFAMVQRCAQPQITQLFYSRSWNFFLDAVQRHNDDNRLRIFPCHLYFAYGFRLYYPVRRDLVYIKFYCFSAAEYNVDSQFICDNTDNWYIVHDYKSAASLLFYWL